MGAARWPAASRRWVTAFALDATAARRGSAAVSDLESSQRQIDQDVETPSPKGASAWAWNWGIKSSRSGGPVIAARVVVYWVNVVRNASTTRGKRARTLAAWSRSITSSKSSMVTRPRDAPRSNTVTSKGSTTTNSGPSPSSAGA